MGKLADLVPSTPFPQSDPIILVCANAHKTITQITATIFAHLALPAWPAILDHPASTTANAPAAPTELAQVLAHLVRPAQIAWKGPPL